MLTVVNLAAMVPRAKRTRHLMRKTICNFEVRSHLTDTASPDATKTKLVSLRLGLRTHWSATEKKPPAPPTPKIGHKYHPDIRNPPTAEDRENTP